MSTRGILSSSVVPDSHSVSRPCFPFLGFLPFFFTIVFFFCSNDAYDAETGVDKDKKESVVNMTGR